jgi:hypothetical protein
MKIHEYLTSDYLTSDWQSKRYEVKQSPSLTRRVAKNHSLVGIRVLESGGREEAGWKFCPSGVAGRAGTLTQPCRRLALFSPKDTASKKLTKIY